ncbi:MAG: hypothetical protein KGH70_08055 [Rhodospirillales bacterium]|nr:hypothetical protein [Rhodospirillales bacterium]
MMKHYRKALVSLYSRVHELEAARVEKRRLALEIQEELLLRIVRAEGGIRKVRELSHQIKIENFLPTLSSISGSHYRLMLLNGWL